MEFYSNLEPKGRYVVGRVWPMGLGTVLLRKPSVSLESVFKYFFFNVFKLF